MSLVRCATETSSAAASAVLRCIYSVSGTSPASLGPTSLQISHRRLVPKDTDSSASVIGTFICSFRRAMVIRATSFRTHVRAVVFGAVDLLTRTTGHNDRVTALHKANGIDVTKVTHAGRAYAAQSARLYGAGVADTKALGGWSDGAFKQCYDRTFPIESIVGAAAFNAKQLETYFVPRSVVSTSLLLVLPVTATDMHQRHLTAFSSRFFPGLSMSSALSRPEWHAANRIKT